MSRSSLLAGFAVLVLFSSFAAAQTFLSLDSQPGDYIGQGLSQTVTPSDGTFFVQNLSNAVQVYFHTADYSTNWDLFFGAPSGLKLTRGEYEGAQRFAFRSPTKPGMDVSGDGRGCNIVAGRFLVSSVSFATDGSLQTLALDFEQHCEGAGPALFGSVRYNSNVSVVPRVSVSDGTVLKGNAGSSDGVVTFSVSLPSSIPVSAQYGTFNNSALAGTDYIATSGTVTFQPGSTSTNITVPIIGDRLARGNKFFQVKLTSAVGAPIGDGEGNLKILDPNISMNVLAMSSEPGDYIGGGQQYLITIADTTFSAARFSDNSVSVALGAMDYWSLGFAAANNAVLTSGTYTNATRLPFQSGGVGMDVSGAGRGCNTLTGQFSVLRANYSSPTSVSAFAADFVQHCEGFIPALYGSVRLNATLRQFSVTDGVVSSGSAVFTITLNPSNTSGSSVTFTTSDGTAVAGTDYVATSQTVSFAPGQIQQTVTVPLLTTGGGKKTFFGQLSSPSGAQAWIGKSSASF
jgi:Calx-beta domain